MFRANHERKFFSLSELRQRLNPTADIETLALDCELNGLRLKQFNNDWFVAELDRAVCEKLITKHSPVKETARLLLTTGALGLVFFLLVSFSLLGRSTAAQDFSRGLKTSHQLAGVTAQNIFNQASQELLTAAVSFKNLPEWLWLKISSFKNRVLTAWGGWLASDEEKAFQLKNEIKAEVKLELKAELDQLIKRLDQGQIEVVGKMPSPTGGGEGLVIVPSSGNETSDRSLTEELRASLSDEVLIEFDGSGQAGKITPVFKTGPGPSYLFILSPLKP